MLAVGLMSGTSLDGVDAVLCEVEGLAENTKVRQIAFETYDMSDDLKEKIKCCCADEGVTTSLICSLNFELGELFANAAKSICDKAGVDSENLGFIASHGQTIYHIPKPYDNYVASTLQIGESTVIAQRCKCPVISNFREMDMACGGEGAPLVPFSEYIFYRNAHHAVALQNIGGIGNVTVLPKNCSIDKVYAFDTGPGNMMIDEAMNVLYQKKYDENGATAMQGKLIQKLADELKNHPYINVVPPKTTGREMFGAPMTRKILEKYQHEKSEDLIYTLTWYTAYTIAQNYEKYVLPKDKVGEVILGGGGAHNKTLITILQEIMPEIKVCLQEDKGYSSDAKEAVAFVILGNETLHRRFSNVPSATGAREKAILGKITYPKESQW
ncbi:MAG: anhydro-N-acetylmuramic acid kinase AnmK [Lachnospiraceae bacterium]|nr:anhydro-N-acetylmuramic acid kinase AnmK [Lachnospiraceae bacterium]